MAGMNYNYDESASSWPYFALTLLIVALVPVSYSYFSGLSSALSTSSDELYAKNGQIKLQEYKTSIDSDLKKYKSKSTRSKIFNKKFVVLLILLISIGCLFYYSQSLPAQDFTNAFDPFEILDISSSATDREIKSHYRKLSLVYHPDKIARDATEAQKEELEAKFVLINKAYKALTDEVTKRNYEEYGHPDGPQDVTHGIALPVWFVEGSYSWILTVLYVIGIAIVLPWGVGKWWNTAQSYTKKGIHVGTARVFTNRMLNHNPAIVVSLESVLRLVSKATEFEILFNGAKSHEDIYNMITAYINRDFSKYDSVDTLKVVAIVPKSIEGLIDIAATFRNTDLVLKSIELNKCIIQAINPSSTKYHQFLQLPHVEISKIDTSFEVHTLTKFFSLSKEEQKKFLGINDKQLQDVIQVASKIPYLKLVKSEFKVPGEIVVPPSAHSHLSIKVLVKSPSDKSLPVISKKSLIEEETIEALRNPFKITSDQPPVPPTYAPFFPEQNGGYNGWMCSLVVQRDNKLSDQPHHFQNLSFENLIKVEEKGELTIGTFKLPLTSTTPPDVGQYQFRCILRSLDYFGNDLEFPIIMKVENPTAEKETDAYGIEDPDEDSVAGVMAALKGELVKKNHEYDSSSDEDESDDEAAPAEESDFSDINTDTEDES